MRAGKLRELIAIEEVTEEPDAHGEPLPVEHEPWEASKPRMIWAEIEELAGREYLDSGGLGRKADVDVKITIRYCADIGPTTRISHEGRRFDVKSVITDPKRRFLELMCKRAA
jgi:SPP1 family predicted phage head-tail adaptor